MQVTNIFLTGDKNETLKFDMSGVIDIPETPEPLQVCIGIDASTTKTGVTVGLTEMDFPFLFLEYERQKDETINRYLNAVIEHIASEVVTKNKLIVTNIFIEDKYENKGKFSKKSSDSLATVKIIMADLPVMIEQFSGRKKPKYDSIPPPTWRKYYLGDLNTNKGRQYMKLLVARFGIQKYDLHPMAESMDDIMDSIGVYGGGLISIVKPQSKDNHIAEVIPNDIEWGHTLVKKIEYMPSHINPIEVLMETNNDFKIRVETHGFKMFEYYQGISAEKNLRSLTTSSNSLFICVIANSDMEAVPLFYEKGFIPKNNETVVLYGYRENIKGGL